MPFQDFFEARHVVADKFLSTHRHLLDIDQDLHRSAQHIHQAETLAEPGEDVRGSREDLRSVDGDGQSEHHQLHLAILHLVHGEHGAR
jgi:hypothetical protein